MRFLKEEEQERLIKAQHGEEGRLPERYGDPDLHTGLRKDELLKLKREDVLVDRKDRRWKTEGREEKICTLNETARLVIISV
jgi:integrase